MEQRALRESRGERRVAELDLEAPRQRGRLAEELVVEVVAEAAGGLGDEHRGGDRVGEGPEADAGQSAADPGADGPADERAEDCDAAVVDADDLPRVGAVVEVVAGVGEHVPDARADDAERDAPEHDVEDDARLGPATGEPSRRDHDRQDDPDADAQRVRADVECEREVPAEGRRQPSRDVETLPLDGRARDAERCEHLVRDLSFRGQADTRCARPRRF